MRSATSRPSWSLLHTSPTPLPPPPTGANPNNHIRHNQGQIPANNNDHLRDNRNRHNTLPTTSPESPTTISPPPTLLQPPRRHRNQPRRTRHPARRPRGLPHVFRVHGTAAANVTLGTQPRGDPSLAPQYPAHRRSRRDSGRRWAGVYRAYCWSAAETVVARVDAWEEEEGAGVDWWEEGDGGFCGEWRGGWG